MCASNNRKQTAEPFELLGLLGLRLPAGGTFSSGPCISLVFHLKLQLLLALWVYLLGVNPSIEVQSSTTPPNSEEKLFPRKRPANPNVGKASPTFEKEGHSRRANSVGVSFPS